jgi:very-long-chain enoyl-CoA reductase
MHFSLYILMSYVSICSIALYCVLFHYAKRELETLFVHRFSNATMPWFNIIKNSTHYWFLSGIMIAYFLYHPLYTAPAWLVAQPPIVLRGLVALFVFAELNNFWCHMILRNLRPANSKARGIPKGNLFSLVSCANYTWEVLAWVVFSVFTQTATSYFFALVSFGQILVWAIKKHKAYRVEFPDYPRRKALIPFVV